MIKRTLAILTSVSIAYVVLYFFGDKLPLITVRERPTPPKTLNKLIADYVLRDDTERIHFMELAEEARWDDAKGTYTLYNLADYVPDASETYGTQGSSVEALYETFLLSVRASADQNYINLLNAFKDAQTRSKTQVAGRNSRTRSAPGSAAADQRLNALLAYLADKNTGPATAAMGRALAAYYVPDRPRIVFPDGHDLNMRRINPYPTMQEIAGEEENIQAVDFTVPDTAAEMGSSGAVKGSIAHVEKLKIVQVAIQRAWIDWSLLRANRNGPWLGNDPHLFGPKGALAQIPVRLVLAEKPDLQVEAAAMEKSQNASATIGPFSYSADEVHPSKEGVQLAPKNRAWVVIAVVTQTV